MIHRRFEAEILGKRFMTCRANLGHVGILAPALKKGTIP